MSETVVGPEEAACFADVRNTSICDLKMARCKLGPTGANKISEMLFYNNSIVSIDLSNNDMEDSGVEKMVHHLSKSSLYYNTLI